MPLGPTHLGFICPKLWFISKNNRRCSCQFCNKHWLGDKGGQSCSCVTIYLKYLKYFWGEKKKPKPKKRAIGLPLSKGPRALFESKSPKSLSSLSSLMLSARRVSDIDRPLTRCIDLRETISTLPGSPRGSRPPYRFFHRSRYVNPLLDVFLCGPILGKTALSNFPNRIFPRSLACTGGCAAA